MTTILNVSGVNKTYEGGHEALKGIDLEIDEGEILALLGPNGAGKTTLISIVCGIATASSGTITVGGYDHMRDYRAARDMIGLVPQEINLEPFETVMNTVRFSRGLFGRSRDDAKIEEILKLLSLHDKKDSRIMTLSGGMKRRVLIAKALCHDPKILFLDEPTAGVDVELRKDMWDIVAKLKETGVTIILTTHYIEEAEAMADRIGVISKGEILLIEEKDALIKRLGQKELIIELEQPLSAVPEGLASYPLAITEQGALVYTYDAQGGSTGITGLLADLRSAGLHMQDLSTRQSSLEDIFVDLVKEDAA